MELQEFIQAMIYFFGLGYLYGRWTIMSSIGMIIFVFLPLFDDKSFMYDPKTSEVLHTPMFWLSLIVCLIPFGLGFYQGMKHKILIKNQ